MTWLVNKTRGVRLYINGVEYSDNLIQINLNDESVTGSGILPTSGSIVLGQISGGTNIEDYDKNIFLRGRPVTINVKTTSGTYIRHPRGRLFIVDSSYNPEDRQLTLDVGCKLYLASLSDNIENLIDETDFDIPEDQQNFASLNSAIQAEGKILWQDNQGDIQKGDFYDGDGLGTNRAAGEWVSILNETAITVEPLGQGNLIPDQIELSYERELTSEEIENKTDQTETFSNYFLVYPATVWTRKRPSDGLSGVDGSCGTSERPGGRESDICGDSPIEPPGPGGKETCSCGYTSEPIKSISAVESYEININYYKGPGGQLSTSISRKYGPAVELNSQYYADLYAFCVWGYGSTCNPSGNCPLTGLAQVLQNYAQRVYEYGPGGELIRTTLDEYMNKLNCAIPSNWRTGTRSVNGMLEFKEFTVIPPDTFFLARRTITEFQYFDTATVQYERTWTSPCGSNASPGIKAGCIEATCGLMTSERRISRSSSASPDAPDRVGNGTFKETVSYTISDERYPEGYVTPPDESAPIVLQMEVPYALQGDPSQAAIAADNLLYYIRALKEGDARGLRITEALRSDIITDWRPGMPFRYVDVEKDKILALRMNACAWAMDPDESLVSIDGLYVGESNGTLSEGSNIEGEDGLTVVYPEIDNETSVLPPRPLFQTIKVNLQLQALMKPGGKDGNLGVVQPAGTQYIDMFTTFVCYVSGGLYEPGSLIAAGAGGSVPLTNGNTLLSSTPVPVDANLFA